MSSADTRSAALAAALNLLVAEGGAAVGTGCERSEIDAVAVDLNLPIRGGYRRFLTGFGWAQVFGRIEVHGLGARVPPYLDLRKIVPMERAEVYPPIPAHLCPIANDGAGNKYCVDTCTNGLIVVWNHELDVDQDPVVVADGFDAWLLDRLLPSPVRRMNARMEGLLAEAGPPPALGHALQTVLSPGLVECGGCIILAAHASSATSENRAASHDETGFEALLNHVHIDDFFVGEDRMFAFRQGLAFIYELEAMLQAAYRDREFEVILTMGDGTVARFHQLRPGQIWLASNLEAYVHEAVLASHLRPLPAK